MLLPAGEAADVTDTEFDDRFFSFVNMERTRSHEPLFGREGISRTWHITLYISRVDKGSVMYPFRKSENN